MKKKVVALVGRPNVGKSTIFNRLAGKKVSIIEDTPGVTRDRIYANCSYKNFSFNIIDTGGIDATKMDFNDEIKMQAEIAISEADVVVFIVDGKEGLTSNDLIVRDILRKTDKKVIVAINKIDVKDAKDNIYDFYELGFDTYIPISSIHNTGFIELIIVSNIFLSLTSRPRLSTLRRLSASSAISFVITPSYSTSAKSLTLLRSLLASLGVPLLLLAIS